MSQFAPVLPELILSFGAIALMMVAAFAGRRSGGWTSWAAVAFGSTLVSRITVPSFNSRIA